MTETQLPSYMDLMLPTLKAVAAVGGSGFYSDIDDRAVELAGMQPVSRSLRVK